MVVLAGQRGAVHILFLIVVLVVALVFGALWFIQLQKNEESENRQMKAEAQSRLDTARFQFYRDLYGNVAPKLGFGVGTDVAWQSGDLPAEVAQRMLMRLEAELRDVGLKVDDPATNLENLEQALRVPINRYATLKGELESKKQEIERLKAEKSGLETSLAKANESHDAERARLQQEHEAEISRRDTQMLEMRTLNDQVQNRIREVTQDIETARDEHNRDRLKLIGEKEDAEAGTRTLKSRLQIERETEKPDGKILSVNPRTGTAMIDITSRTQLRRGTRFKVYETGKGGVKIHKGWLTVTNTGANMSEARVEQASPGTGGPESGDWLYNPYFNAGETVRFVFLGQIPGRFTRETAERILEGFGAAVDDKVTINTSFLVLGEKDDPDDPELTESQDYRNAITWGVEIIRARDLVPFLQM